MAEEIQALTTRMTHEREEVRREAKAEVEQLNQKVCMYHTYTEHEGSRSSLWHHGYLGTSIRCDSVHSLV